MTSQIVVEADVSCTTVYNYAGDRQVLCGELNTLFKQLSDRPVKVTVASLEELISNRKTETVALLIREGRVIGMAQASFIRPLNGGQIHINCVVIDKAFRGRGYGTKLMEYLLHVVKEKWGAYLPLSVQLTSKPSRSAGSVYKRVGFELTATDVYRLRLG